MIFPWQNSNVTASFPGPAQFLVHCLQYVCGEPGNEAKKVTQLYFFNTYIQQEVCSLPDWFSVETWGIFLDLYTVDKLASGDFSWQTVLLLEVVNQSRGSLVPSAWERGQSRGCGNWAIKQEVRLFQINCPKIVKSEGNRLRLVIHDKNGRGLSRQFE